MADAKRDNNSITTLIALSLADGVTPVALWADPTTHRLLVDTGAAGGGLTVGTTTITSGSTTNILYDNAGVLGEYTITGTGTAVVMANTPTLITPVLGVATGTSLALGGATIGTDALGVSGTASIAGSSAAALSVGLNGSTNPSFVVDNSTALQVAGLKVKGAVTGGNVAISVIDSGAAANLAIDAKGTGTIQVGNTSTGAITLSRATTLSLGLTVSASGINSTGLCTFLDTASNTAGNTRFRLRNAADLLLTAGSGATFLSIEMNNAVRTHASNTAIATQTDANILGTTHAFQSATGNITDMIAVQITPGNTGTNATATNAHGLRIATAAVSANITNAYGLTVLAPSGASTLNVALNLTGPLYLRDNTDPTKIATFASSTIATGTTRTFTFPDASGTLTALGNASTGSGSVVLATTPTLVTPVIGAATGTSLTLSAPGTSSTDVPNLANTVTFTNKFVTPQVQSVADAGGTFTPVSLTNDFCVMTALSQATTIAAPTGSPVQGERLVIRIKDNGTARALTWNAIYRASSDLALPTTTILSKTMYCGFMYNATDSKWDLVAFLNNF